VRGGEEQQESQLRVREATPADMEAIAALVSALGYETGPDDVRHRMKALAEAGLPVLVAEKGGVIGVLTASVTKVLHRPRPVGRISMLVVDERYRGGGIGAALVAEAEKKLEARGCGLIEVTSNLRRDRAHAFYERAGYERSSYRFVKALSD
jgi:ribosomal protein S18 acetylase RimI-like enzyme